MHRRASTERRPAAASFGVVLSLVTVLVTAVAVAWALVTPPLRAPDEAQHLNSVLRLAYGGGWPAPGRAAMAPAVLAAQAEAAVLTDLPGRYHDRPDRAQFVDVVPPPVTSRTQVGAATALAPGPPARSAEIDQMTQHPPLYYAVGAAFLRVTGLADARWDLQLLALRLLGVAHLVPLAPLAALSVRRLTRSRAAALVAASLTLFAPQVGHVLGSVTNDALMTLAGAVVTYLCVRVLTGDLRRRTVAAVGLALGLGLATKVMAGLALPMVVAAYLLARGDARPLPRLARAAAALAVAFAVGGWWWARNLLVHGTVQPVGMGTRFADRPPGGFWDFWPTAVWRLVRSSFGDLAWLELRLPVAYVAVAGAACAALCLVPLIRPGYRREAAVLLSFPVLVAASVLPNAWAFYREHGWYAGLQGRYLFGTLVALGAVAAVGAWTALGRSERRTGAALPLVLAAGCCAAAGGLWFGLLGMYHGPGEPVGVALERWAGWSPLAGTQLAAAAGALAVVGLAAVGAAATYAAALRRGVREEGRAGADDGDDDGADDGGPPSLSRRPAPAGT